MTKKSILAVAALGVVSLSSVPQSADACYVCSSAQWCVAGSQGSSCMVYDDPDGVQRCQYTTDCGIEMTMTPLQVSPAGTYLASAGARMTNTGTEALACNGFVVAHTEEPADARAARTIRI